MRWSKKSVGNVMTERVPAVLPSFTFSQVQSFLEKNSKNFETISYIYIVDEKGKFVGVFSIEELYRFPLNTRVDAIGKKAVFYTVQPTAHQEEAAHIALQHTLREVPVVDASGIFLGAVSSHTIFCILHKEFREDIFHLTGIHHEHAAFDNIFKIPISKALKHRFPWLFIGLLGGVLAAKIIGIFESTLEKNLILAAYIPLIVYIADAVGTQLEAFTIRDLALFRTFHFSRYFLKHFSIVFILALFLSFSISGINFFIDRDLSIAIVLGIAIFGATLSALFTGIIIPFFFRRLHLDPANGSGPIGTIIQDLLSVFIYFSIAFWLL